MDPLIIGLIVAAVAVAVFLVLCLVTCIALDTDLTLLWCRIFGTSISKSYLLPSYPRVVIDSLTFQINCRGRLSGLAEHLVDSEKQSPCNWLV